MPQPASTYILPADSVHVTPGPERVGLGAHNIRSLGIADAPSDSARVRADLESSGNVPSKAGSPEFCARQPIVLESVGLAG